MRLEGRRKARSLLLLALAFLPCMIFAGELEGWQLEGIKAALNDSNTKVKQLALIKLSIKNVPELHPHFESLMKVEDDELAFSAIKAFAASGAEASLIANRVVEILGPRPPASGREVEWLRDWEREPTRQSVSVQALLHHSDAGVRVMAFSAFAAMVNDPTNISGAVTLLDDSLNRAGAANALIAMGDKLGIYEPEVRNLLQSQNAGTRLAAIRVLIAMKIPVDEFTSPLLDLLNDSSAHFEVLTLLYELGPQAQMFAPILVERIDSFRRDSRPALFTLIGHLGGISEADLALELLQSDDARQQSEAVAFFTATGIRAQATAPRIVPLLNHDDDALRLRALQVLVAIGADPVTYSATVHSFVDQLPDFSYSVATVVLNALATMGAEVTRQHIPQVIKTMAGVSQQKPGLEQAVGRFFEQFGEATEIASELAILLDDEKETTNLLALEAMAAIGPQAMGGIERVRRFADQSNPTLRKSALRALVKIAPGNLDVAAFVIEHSLHPVTEPWIDELGPFTQMSELLTVIEPGYASGSLSPHYLFFTHFLGGGEAVVEELLEWIGDPDNPVPISDSVADNSTHLQLLRNFWDSSIPNSRIRRELVRQISRVVSATTWREAQIPLLESIADRFRNAMPADETDQTRAALDVVEGKLVSARPGQADWWTSAVLWAIGSHLLFWSLLVLAYPRSVWVQTWFFWNPWMLRIAGLGYVNLVLTSVPLLRRLLFTPFRDALAADASLDDLLQQAYFPGVQVRDHADDSLQPIERAIPEVRGHVYLEGESGLGKSMFLRRLALNPPRILAYLPAVHCSGGVLEALQNKLPGVGENRGFLESLIYAGAFDIIVDGLNEVSAEVRASIVQFLQRFARGNILVASQPIEWNPPSSLHKFTLEPLANDQIEAFLTSRRAIQPADATVSGVRYDEACYDFLQRTLGDRADADITTRRVLSNPMDLTVVAHMLSLGEMPNLYSLQAQQFDHMAAEYSRTHAGAGFPLDGLAERAFAMRMNETSSLPQANFEDALNCMERHRMVVSRHSTDSANATLVTRYFRHDKVADFFIVNGFLKHRERISERLGDSRFQGVYLLLAASLPIDQARDLRDELLSYAAETKDHTVSDSVFKILKERQSRGHNTS